MPTRESAFYNGALDVAETTGFAFRTFRPDASPSDVARTKYVKAPYAEAVTAPAALQPGLKAVWHDFRGNLCAGIDAAPVKGEYVVESVSIPAFSAIPVRNEPYTSAPSTRYILKERVPLSTFAPDSSILGFMKKLVDI